MVCEVGTGATYYSHLSLSLTISGCVCACVIWCLFGQHRVIDSLNKKIYCLFLQWLFVDLSYLCLPVQVSVSRSTGVAPSVSHLFAPVSASVASPPVVHSHKPHTSVWWPRVCWSVCHPLFALSSSHPLFVFISSCDRKIVCSRVITCLSYHVPVTTCVFLITLFVVSPITNCLLTWTVVFGVMSSLFSLLDASINNIWHLTSILSHSSLINCGWFLAFYITWSHTIFFFLPGHF